MAWRLVRVVQPVGDKADAAEDSTLVRLRHASAAVNDPDVPLSQAAIKKCPVKGHHLTNPVRLRAGLTANHLPQPLKGLHFTIELPIT